LQGLSNLRLEHVIHDPGGVDVATACIMRSPYLPDLQTENDFSKLLQDPVAAFMDLCFSKSLEISDFLSLPEFPGKYGFLKELLLLLIHGKYQLLSSDRDKVSSVLKLLGWLLWKSTFT
jgi:hypothetical protein